MYLASTWVTDKWDNCWDRKVALEAWLHVCVSVILSHIPVMGFFMAHLPKCQSLSERHKVVQIVGSPAKHNYHAGKQTGQCP